MTASPLRASLVLAVVAGCSQPPPSADVSAGATAGRAAPTPQVPGATSRDGEPAASTPPATLQDPVIGGACPAPGGPVDDEIAAQAAALVPLKAGLTLATAWHRTTEADDVECLTQVLHAGPQALEISAGCAMRDGTVVGTRRTCRADLRSAYAYYSGAGDDETLTGTTMFSLSAAAFTELKRTRTTTHRNVSIDDGAMISDLRGALSLDGSGAFPTIVNDRVVELPVVRASGVLRGRAMGRAVETRVRAAILDDERFPLVLEYEMPDIGATGFVIRYTRVSFPTEGLIERRLAEEKRTDVYGIYFDFASDRLRSESEPVLQEIAGALSRHPDWTLRINGHTDGVGGPAANLRLSERRAAAVRGALVERFGIAADRLDAQGFGATVPKAGNDTREGRARNRRVELVRQ
jgi:outer membrane protein OmpA-like peptidoglycan-associated protein